MLLFSRVLALPAGTKLLFPSSSPLIIFDEEPAENTPTVCINGSCHLTEKDDTTVTGSGAPVGEIQDGIVCHLQN